MTSLLIVIIYLAAVSMGLPDSLLGSAWPMMRLEMNAPVAYAGAVSMIIAGGTIVSSFCSDRVIRRFRVGLVAAVSTALTAVALFGFSISTAFWQLCLWAVPYGLGAGCIDAALNNYIALYFKSRQMSWFHCFWGVGATTGPYVMGLCLAGGLRWGAGYRTIGGVQLLIALALLASLKMWKSTGAASEKEQTSLRLREVLRLAGVKPILVAFFCYCTVETTAGLWASSFMVLERGVSPEAAAQWASVFYLGITLGRFLCGFISERLGDRLMVRLGQCVMIAGAVVLLLPLGEWGSGVGLVLVGLGCAPVYPCLLHETPVNFGREKSQAIMGIQMACAYMGSTFMPPVFGWLAGRVGMGLYPVFLLGAAALMIVMVEPFNALKKRAA